MHFSWQGLFYMIIILASIAVFFLVTAYFAVWPLLSERIFKTYPIHCPEQSVDERVNLNYSGFVTMVPRYGDSGDSGDNEGFHEFILKPGSTGYITKTFEYGKDKDDTIRNQFKITPYQYYTFIGNPIGSKLHGKGFVGGSLNSTKVTFSLYKVTNSTKNYSITVTYAITADPSAKMATYYLNLHQQCVGDILTIGEIPYQHSLPWDAVFLY
jgi:hypothetical protein